MHLPALSTSALGRGIATIGGFIDSFGDGMISRANALAIDPSGRIVIGGEAEVPGTIGIGVLERLLPTGSPDAAFGNHGQLTLAAPAAILSLALQPDGKIIAGGDGISPLVARFSPQGLDKTFGAAGINDLSTIDYPDSSTISALALDQAGNIIAASDFTLYRLAAR